MPVVVELFTSEGCTSCPATDDILPTLEAWGPELTRRVAEAARALRAVALVQESALRRVGGVGSLLICQPSLG